MLKILREYSQDAKHGWLDRCVWADHLFAYNRVLFEIIADSFYFSFFSPL